MGRFPGLMKLFGDGATSKRFVKFGDEKSSIWLLYMMPVEEEPIFAPKLPQKNQFIFQFKRGAFAMPYWKFMVLVTDTASPFGAITQVCEVPWSSGFQNSPP